MLDLCVMCIFSPTIILFYQSMYIILLHIILNAGFTENSFKEALTMVIPLIAIYGAISLLVEIFSAVLWYVVIRFYNLGLQTNMPMMTGEVLII